MTILKRKRFWASIIVLPVIIWLFRDFNFEEVWGLIKSINFWYLIPLSVSELAIAFTRSQRWKYIIDPGKKIGTWDIFSTFSIGMMMNLVMPALTGQVARIILISKKEGIKKTFAFTSLVLEVLFDAIVLVFLLVLVSTFYVIPDDMSAWWHIGALVVIGLAVALFWMSRKHGGSSAELKEGRFKQINSFREKMREMEATFIYGLKMLRSRKHLFLVTGLTILSWSFQAIMVFLLIKAFGLEIDLWGSVVVMVINTVLVTIVIFPVNIGMFQFACVIALGLFGIEKQTALSFSIVLHFFNYLPPVLLGWLFSLKEGLSIKKLYKERSDSEDQEINLGPVELHESVKK